MSDAMKTAIVIALDAYLDALQRGMSHREAQQCAIEEAGQHAPDLAKYAKRRSEHDDILSNDESHVYAAALADEGAKN